MTVTATFTIKPDSGTVVNLGAKLLREWRVSQGLSQRAAAHLLGISQAFMFNLERGKRLPGLVIAHQIDRRSGGRIPGKAWIARPMAIFVGSDGGK